MDKESLRRKDFVASLILLVIGILVLIESIKMTFFVEIPGVESEGWFVAPGVFPLMLSTGLVIMSLIVLATVFKETTIKFTGWEKIRDVFKSKDNLIMAAEIGLLFFYTFILLGRMHFAIATSIYLFLAMFIVKAASWYKIAIISVAVSIAIAYVFGTLFKVPLP